jgi:hypothetical protein
LIKIKFYPKIVGSYLSKIDKINDIDLIVNSKYRERISKKIESLTENIKIRKFGD